MAFKLIDKTEIARLRENAQFFPEHMVPVFDDLSKHHTGNYFRTLKAEKDGSLYFYWVCRDGREDHLSICEQEVIDRKFYRLDHHVPGRIPWDFDYTVKFWDHIRDSFNEKISQHQNFINSYDNKKTTNKDQNPEFHMDGLKTYPEAGIHREFPVFTKNMIAADGGRPSGVWKDWKVGNPNISQKLYEKYKKSFPKINKIKEQNQVLLQQPNQADQDRLMLHTTNTRTSSTTDWFRRLQLYLNPITPEESYSQKDIEKAKKRLIPSDVEEINVKLVELKSFNDGKITISKAPRRSRRRNRKG